MDISEIEKLIRADGGVAGEWRGEYRAGIPYPKPTIMGIGEAPGAQEQRQGRPFIGAAGQLLDQLLVQSGVRAIYLTNYSKIRPPVKDRKQTAPTPKMLRTWRPFVEAEIRAVRPDVILCFGKTAAKLVTPTGVFSMKDVVGKRYEWEGVPTTVVYHPAAFLHGAEERGNAYKLNQWRRIVSGMIGRAVPEYSIEEVQCGIDSCVSNRAGATEGVASVRDAETVLSE